MLINMDIMLYCNIHQDQKLFTSYQHQIQDSVVLEIQPCPKCIAEAVAAGKRLAAERKAA